MTPTQIPPGFWALAMRRKRNGLTGLPWPGDPQNYWDYYDRQEAHVSAGEHT